MKRRETPLQRIKQLVFNPPGVEARKKRERKGGLIFYNPVPKVGKGETLC